MRSGLLRVTRLVAITDSIRPPYSLPSAERFCSRNSTRRRSTAASNLNCSANRWADGTVSPDGYLHIERFHLEGTTPVWTFALADALLEKRVFMQSGASNTTYILYTLVRASAPVQLSIKALADNCPENCTTAAGESPMEVTPVERGLRITAYQGAVPLYVLSDSGRCSTC